MIRKHWLVFSALALSILQIGFLGWIIAGRAAVLQNGAEAVLKVRPVDPRDLLRGDYVILSYEIANLPVGLIANPPAGDFVEEGPVFVRLARGAEGYWEAVSANLGTLPAAPPADGEVDIRGTTGGSVIPNSVMGVDYGIDRFYVPEGEGRAIEDDMRVRPFGVKVAIGRDGAAQIKALLDGDKVLYEEPPY